MYTMLVVFQQFQCINLVTIGFLDGGLGSADSASCRFAILSGPTIPIIGEGDEEANDRYFRLLFIYICVCMCVIYYLTSDFH